LNRIQRYIIALTGNYVGEINLEIDLDKSSSGDNSGGVNIMLIYFLVSIAIILILTWIILTIIKIRYQR